ncbi:MAG: Uma2 family endonuclease [Chloroflexota bacterium]
MIETQPNRQKQEASIFERAKRFSVAEYHQWMDAGILTEDHALELLEGIIFEKMPIHPPHRFVTDEIRQILMRIVKDGYYVSGQQPVTTVESEPEPDVFVVRGRSRDFLQSHPTPKNVPLVIEVSDSTLMTDQQVKKRIYARAGIPIYWIVNLNDRQLELYSEPLQDIESPNYRQQTIYFPKDEFPVVIDGQTIGQIKVADILP